LQPADHAGQGDPVAQRFVDFDLWQPAAEDFLYMESSYDLTTRQRWTDTHTWGIMRPNAYPAVVNIPVSSINAAPPLWPVTLGGTVSLDTATGLVSVGAGSSSSSNPPVAGLIAYDLYGQRIPILNDSPFNFSTVSPYGLQSSGNVSIPLNLSGTSGDCATNPSIPGTYYLWIQYLEVNLPQAVVAKDASVHYPEVTDGYQILLTNTPNAPVGDGISIFLAKIVWIGGSGVISATTANVIDGNNNGIFVVSATAGDPGRVWCAERSQDVEIIVDQANKTPAYGLAQGAVVLSLRDHVNAMGAGTPTANNPHALTLADIPGAGQEPIATQNQSDSLAKGIVDLNLPQNSPPFSVPNPSACQSTIQLVGLVPLPSLDPLAAANGITSTAKTRWVRITDLTGGPLDQAVFLSGLRLLELFPNVTDTLSPGPSDPSVIPSNPNSGDGWVGFNAAEDTPGMYLIYGTTGQLASGLDVFVVTKMLMPGWPSTIPALATNQLALSQVYWDGVELYRNPTEPSTSDPVLNQPDDLRSLGLVGPQQLSSVLKADPVMGGLAQEVFENLVQNSNYSAARYTDSVTEIDLGAGYILSSPSVALTGGDLATGGAAAWTGRQWTMNAGTFLTPSWIFHALLGLKPQKKYGLSFWAKASATFNAMLGVTLTAGNAANPTSLITQDGVTTAEPLAITLRTDNLWHRYSIVLQTLPSVVPNPALPYYLCFQYEPGGVTPTAGQISVTNIQLTEGEWVPGYQGSSTDGMQAINIPATNIPAPNSGAGTNYQILSASPVPFQSNGGVADINAYISGGTYISLNDNDETGLTLTVTSTLLIDGVVVDTSTVVSSLELGNASSTVGGLYAGSPLMQVLSYLGPLSPGAHTIQVGVLLTATAAGPHAGGGAITINQANAKILQL
jgi:hypothetical protein